MAGLSEELARRRLSGDRFCVSALTHFQIAWGYFAAGRDAEKYAAFLERTNVEVAPLTKLDAEDAARMKPSERDALDCLIASTVKRYGAEIWTADRDLLKFLPKDRVRLVA